MRTEYNTIEAAIKKYPALKTTVTKANKIGMKLLSHCAQFNKRGTVNSHWFRTEELGFERNQRINGHCNIVLRARKESERKNLSK